MGKFARNILVFLVLSVMVLAVLAGCGNKEANQSEGDTSVPVATAVVKTGTLNDGAVVSGKLEALESAKVVPNGTGGKVSAVRVDIGSQVQKGQVIVMLESAMEAAKLNEARASVNMANTAYQVASDNYERGKKLLAQGAIAQVTFDVQYEQAYEQARTAQAQAAAGLKMASESYDYTIIKSPISGVITSRSVNPGEMASPGEPVVSVVNLDKVVVQSTVAEGLINKLKQGQAVDVVVDAVSSTPFKGTVTNIAPAADATSKAFPIKVQIANANHTLKPGMFAEVHLTSDTKETLLVPRDALTKLDGADVVWVIENNKAASRKVTAGVSDGENVEIKAGLKEGEQVVTSGQDSLQENAKVAVKN